MIKNIFNESEKEESVAVNNKMIITDEEKWYKKEFNFLKKFLNKLKEQD